MRKKCLSSTFAIAALCAALAAIVLAPGAGAAVRHFDATVIAKDSSSKTIQVRTESGAKLTVKVNARTEFERISGGFGGLTKGMAIEIDASNASGRWVAIQIEPQSANGGGGGGGDDNGGDDHGGHGGGHDDGPNHT
jgi:Domain of unknown function (DUF5666)